MTKELLTVEVLSTAHLKQKDMDPGGWMANNCSMASEYGFLLYINCTFENPPTYILKLIEVAVSHGAVYILFDRDKELSPLFPNFHG